MHAKEWGKCANTHWFGYGQPATYIFLEYLTEGGSRSDESDLETIL